MAEDALSTGLSLAWPLMLLLAPLPWLLRWVLPEAPSRGMQALKVPTLIMNGDEDDPCLDVGLFMKRNIHSSALVLLPRSGHLINLEEPALFNQMLGDFITRVDAGRWEMRDERSITTDILWTPDT